MFLSVHLFKLSCLSILEQIFCTVPQRKRAHLIKGELLLMGFLLRTLTGAETAAPAPIAISIANTDSLE
jgi:hypothetical protein